MNIDLSKLTPAPWIVRETDRSWCAGPDGCPVLLAEMDNDAGRAAVSFVALARNAFDVMMRRGWGVVKLETGKWVLEDTARKGWLYLNGQNWFADDPYEAAKQMIDADRWYCENVEKAKVVKVLGYC